MGKEVIHLSSGKTVLAETNGKSLDGQRGYVLIAVDTGNLYRSLRESTEIEVEKRDGKWWEVSNLYLDFDRQPDHSDSSESAWWNPLSK